MIVHKDLEQKSIEWFELRWGKIGGTSSKGLFVKGDTLFLDILSQRIEEFEPSDGFSNDAMDRGNELEPFAVEYLDRYLNVKFETVGWLQSEENELLGISPDGITADLKQACEIKCLSRKKHVEVLVNNVMPLDYVHQCIHYFTVNPNLEKLHFLAFRPESIKNFYRELTLDSLVNIGTNAKPVTVTISDAVKLAKTEAKILLDRIEMEIEKLKF